MICKELLDLQQRQPWHRACSTYRVKVCGACEKRYSGQNAPLASRSNLNSSGGEMSCWKTLSFGLFLLCSATVIQAQREYEITPFIGSRFGGNIDLSQQGNPNVDFLKVKSSINYGVMG